MRKKGQLFDLKRFREDHKLTQRKIAEDVNLNPSFLSTIEHGKRPAPASLLDKLSELYKVDNIGDYISEEIDSKPHSVEDVKNSVVNSPGSSVVINELGKAFTIEELKKLLLMKDLVKEQIQTESSKSPHLDEASVIFRLIKLLEIAEQRTYLADKRIKELEEQIDDLKSQLKNDNS
ncbi:MAG: helix-turn-helix transcriptional regulator [Muribaculaceae bacterium]|nr:helix-turn-helix transcriptional regulator [Muribaculaceae bacterium]